ncbi:hypothetical protein PVAND_016778 [Polypedilum vanderplanki]|uniref:Uncharacterized protein n=1 Tax=Polypedilum vanderplanki TaxID=319348 RepID=A0A9J6BGS7_POLVA|nr:hypothetical protein PVAND_016778 [Polypedilum vanderplanki]
MILSIYSSQTKSSTLNCSFKITTFDFSSDTIYICEVENKEIFDNDEVKIDAIHGDHKDSHENDDINGLSIENSSKLKKFPKLTDEIFENLIYISIHDTNLKELNENDLKSMTKLKFLFITDSKLKILKCEIFQHNLDLEVISFADNDLIHIDPFVFTDLKKLKHLDLTGATCRTSFDLDKTNEGISELIKAIERFQCVSYCYLMTLKIDCDDDENESSAEELEEDFESLEEKLTTFVILVCIFGAVIFIIVTFLLGFMIFNKLKKKSKNIEEVERSTDIVNQ